MGKSESCMWYSISDMDTLRSTNIAMGNPPFEDVSPIKNWWFSIARLVYLWVLVSFRVILH